MDIDSLRIVVLLLSFAVFAGIAAWAWSRRNRQRFEDAARLPFLDGGGAPPDHAPKGWT